MVELIIKKRSGEHLSRSEIENLVRDYCGGKIPDYQMSAFLMAVYFRGMSEDETVDLTRAMLESGDRLDLRSVAGPKIDKHSTGGVGDKVSIILGPLVAACGVRVPMISGRGLAHTGGTLDKLESIPGFTVSFSEKQFLARLKRFGLVIAGQSSRWVPADKKIYALRDVTGTVECIPLIVGSILSKKIASGIEGLVLDIKVGAGGFSRTPAQARRLARALLDTAERWDLATCAVLTRMDEPLGRAVGNAPEIEECVRALRGEWEPDLKTVTMALSAEMLLLAGLSQTRTEARGILNDAVHSGRALDCFRSFVKGQGGDPRVADDPGRLPRARVEWPVRSVRSGFVQGIDAYGIGMAAVRLGAGRAKVTDVVKPAVGLWLDKKTGESVKKGEVVARLLADSKIQAEETAARVLSAYQIGPARKKPTGLILGRMHNRLAL